MKFLSKFRIIFILTIFSIISCRKAVEVNPPITGLVGATVYSDNNTAASALTGIYMSMSIPSTIGGGPTGISAILGLSSDELVPYPNSSSVLTQVYLNSLTNTSNIVFWNQLYNYIYQANIAIEQLNKSTGVTNPLKQQLIGEAKFIRAFCYFYLTNIYGDVPLAISSDYRVNSVATRTPKSQVYEQIIADLKDAQTSLNDNFFTPLGANTTERVRPNKAAATALLARVFLYLGDWVNSESQASSVITNPLFNLVALTDVFKKNSNEAIWQLQILAPAGYTYDGQTFNLISSGGPNTLGNPFFISNFLISSFETGDLRKTNWVGSIIANGQTYFFPYKYKIASGATISEYTTIFRLSEQFLIRAEARAQQGNISGALADLNVIRIRAGLPISTAATKSALLVAIEQERRIELFTEYGHRWLDLKREKGFSDPLKSRADELMSVITPLKGGTWNSNWQLFPISLSELQANPNLVQNNGY